MLFTGRRRPLSFIAIIEGEAAHLYEFSDEVDGHGPSRPPRRVVVLSPQMVHRTAVATAADALHSRRARVCAGVRRRSRTGVRATRRRRPSPPAATVAAAARRNLYRSSVQIFQGDAADGSTGTRRVAAAVHAWREHEATATARTVAALIAGARPPIRSRSRAELPESSGLSCALRPPASSCAAPRYRARAGS